MKKPLWQREGYTSQSAYHRSRKKAVGLCLSHGCYNPVRVRIVDGKIQHKFSYCSKHATRKSRGF